MTATPATAQRLPLESPAATWPPGRSLGLAFTVGSLAAILGSVLYMSTNAKEPREAFEHWTALPASVALVTGCLILVLALARWRSGVPEWATLGASVGVALAAAFAYETLSSIRAVAQGTDNALFEDLLFENTTILIPLFVKSAILFVSLVAIGVTGLRRKALPKPSAIAFIVAGVVSLIPIAQPGLIALSLALLLTARSAHSL